jgi:serine phosphatase RsbU (regulator of sigma subunit)/pSer/pThr/pTyr-binding forkhead associated (FHA) protein
MAHLVIRKGANPGHRISLAKDTVILGRSPDCDIPIPSPSISRQHARLVCLEDKWYIEDMMSRNGTYVNSQAISARTPLSRNDRIRICDFEADFQDAPTSQSIALKPAPTIEESDLQERSSSSTLTALAMHGTKVLDSQPLQNLRAILQVSNRLMTTLEMDQLLPKIAESVFQMFKQTERCFIVLVDEVTGEMVQKVARTRGLSEDESVCFSRSVVRQCVETQQAFLSEDIPGEKRPVSKSLTDASIRSILCTPLIAGENRSLGAIQLDTSQHNQKFTAQDLKLLVGLVNQVSIALQNALLYQEMQKREQIERDLELAAQVQRSILPDKEPQFPGYKFFYHYASALEVGGDYFDFIGLPQSRLAITLGDVAGKSVPAAILMAKLSSDVRTCLLTEVEPAAALTKLNQLLYRNLRQTDRWVTFTTALLDAATRIVTVVNAGHLAPLLYRHSTNKVQEAIPTEASGVPLGVEEKPRYRACQVELQAGDCLLFFTDGVTDAVNAQNQRFRVEGILDTLQHGGPYTPQQLGERVVKAVRHHAAGHSQYDDITLVAFGRIQ